MPFSIVSEARKRDEGFASASMGWLRQPLKDPQ
jgi:hypothetical protein